MCQQQQQGRLYTSVPEILGRRFNPSLCVVQTYFRICLCLIYIFIYSRILLYGTQFMLCNFLVWVLKFKIFSCPQKVEKTTQKVACLWQLGFFFLFSPDCPKQPELPFRFINSFIRSSLLRSLVRAATHDANFRNKGENVCHPKNCHR